MGISQSVRKISKYFQEDFGQAFIQCSSEFKEGVLSGPDDFDVTIVPTAFST